MKLSKKIKQVKENVMLGIHNNKVPMSLEELKKHNTRIDDAIEQIEKGEGSIKEVN
jgi:hypothetical protein